MPTCTHDIDLEQLLSEHHTLLRQYARVQDRCSDLLQRQAAEIEQLRAQLMRQRADAVLRTSALAWAREDHADLEASIPHLPRRAALLRHVEQLMAQVQELMRERLRWQWSTASPGATTMRPTDSPASCTPAIAAMTDGTDRTASPPSPAAAARPQRVWVHDLAETASLETEAEDLHQLEASLVAADLVICQTGCLSHGAYWRVQDHCQRTGKACVVVEQPEALRIVRIHQATAGGDGQETLAQTQGTTPV